MTQNKHFDQHLDTRIVCDASNTGKYSVNKLELLGVVWAIEHFKYFICGKHFTVITISRLID